MMLLHGEQYLQIKGPIPTSGTLVSEARFSEVLDKGKAAAVTSVTTTRNKETGEVVFENQSTVFIRGAGGFGGQKTGKDRGAATAVNKVPSRKPDSVSEFKTLPIQAALYRLSGDYNPLHIDPNFAKIGGFDQVSSERGCFDASESGRADLFFLLVSSCSFSLFFMVSASLVSAPKRCMKPTELSLTSKCDSPEVCTRVKRSLRKCGRRTTKSSSVSFQKRTHRFFDYKKWTKR